MPFIPIPNIAQVCWQLTLAGQAIQFCLSFRKDSPPITLSDLTSLATQSESWWGATLRLRLSTGVVCAQVVATDQTTQGAPQATVTSGAAGTVGSASLPSNVAAVVSLRTAIRGRSYRGRAYIPGIPLSAQSSATDMTGGFATNLITDFSTLLTNLASLGWHMCVPSRQHNGVVLVTGNSKDVTAFVVDAHFDSQRRRLFGRGT
jgi:hypothetical protein